MNNVIEKLRTYGIKGVINFMNEKRWARGIVAKLTENARKYRMNPERGITIVAALGGGNSLCKVMRDFAFNLKECGIPFQTYDLSEKRTVPDQDIESILTPESEFRLLKYDHLLEMFSSPVPPLAGIKRSRIVFWEFESGLLEYDPKLNDGVETIGMSDFDCDVFRNLLPASTSVRKLLYPFRFETPRLDDLPEIRRRYGIGEKDFVVFFNFDFNSSLSRKNPDGALRAFAEAFKVIPNAKLVYKTIGAKSHPNELAALIALAEELDVAEKFITINDYIPQADLYGLTAVCDTYLSLHRGEGFGLGIAEAMSLGKPVVVTDYSSTTEFCHPDNFLPVPFKLVPVRSDQIDNPCYRFVTHWAEPDVAAAAQALLALYDNHSLRTRLGSAAKEFITSYFSIENCKRSVNSYLT